MHFPSVCVGPCLDQIAPMSRKKQRVLALIAVPVLVAVGTPAMWWASADRVIRIETERKPLAIDATALDIGRMWVSDRVTRSLPIRNQTDTSLVLESFKGDCSCISVGEMPVSFGPGETKVVHLVLDLTRTDVPRNGEGPYRAVLSGTAATQDGRKVPLEWVLTGRVEKALRAEPNEIRFGVHSARQGSVTRTVSVDAAEGVASLDVDGSGPWEVRVRPDERDRRRFAVTIQSRGALPPREVADVITLHPVTADEKRLPPEKVTLRGEFVSDVLPTPRVLNLGRQACGVIREEFVRLESLSRQSFRVKGIVNSSKEIEVQPDSSQSGMYLYRLTICPKQQGQQRVSVGFEIEESSGAAYTLDIPIMYQGVASGAP